MALRDPKAGDGSFTGPDTTGEDGGGPAAQAALAPVIGGLSPVRSAGQREAIEDADSAGELLDPADAIDARRYPTLLRLAAGLAEDRWDGEFERGLEDMLDRIAVFVGDELALRRD